MAAARLLIFSSDDSNMRYAAGVDIPDPFLWLRLGDERGKEFIVTSKLEYSRAKKEAKPGIKVLPLEKVDLQNIRKPVGRKHNLADTAAALLLSYNVTEVVVPENCWAIHLETLREHGLRPKVTGPFFPSRSVKSPKEIVAIKKTGLVAKKALQKALAILKESTIDWNDCLMYKNKKLTSEILRAEIDRVFLDNNCVGIGTIVACGEHAAQPHNRGSGPLYAGQPIVLDLFPRDVKTGYYFDMTRTVVKGTPSKELVKLYNAVKKAQAEALAVVAPGKASQVHAAVQEVFDAQGYKTTDEEGFIHSTGHGLGLDIHELPRISAKSDDILQAGNVITIEPGLYYKELGGVRIEDTVLVTRTGCSNLTNIPKVLVVK